MYFDSHKETNESTLFVVEGDDDHASVVGVLAVGAGAVVGAMGGGAVGGAAGAPGVLSHHVGGEVDVGHLPGGVEVDVWALQCGVRVRGPVRVGDLTWAPIWTPSRRKYTTQHEMSSSVM